MVSLQIFKIIVFLCCLTKLPRDVEASEAVTNPLKEGLIMAIVRVSEFRNIPYGFTKEGWRRSLKVADFKCDHCGKVFTTRARHEKTYNSCGCQQPVAAKKVLTGNTYRRTHNDCKSQTYKSWSGIKARCTLVNHVEYHRYGARGITLCNRWLSYENFLADMGARPDGTSIDRIDVNGHYEPGNCRWATDIEQARNTRSNVVLSIGGMSKCVAEWAENPLAVDAKLIYHRLKKGFPPVEAVFCEKRGKWHS